MTESYSRPRIIPSISVTHNVIAFHLAFQQLRPALFIELSNSDVIGALMSFGDEHAWSVVAVVGYFWAITRRCLPHRPSHTTAPSNGINVFLQDNDFMWVQVAIPIAAIPTTTI